MEVDEPQVGATSPLTPIHSQETTQDQATPIANASQAEVSAAAASSTPAAAPEPVPEPVAAPAALGRGRRKRSLAPDASTSTPSQAAATAHDAVPAPTIATGRAKRKAATAARKIVETDDEEDTPAANVSGPAANEPAQVKPNKIKLTFGNSKAKGNAPEKETETQAPVPSTGSQEEQLAKTLFDDPFAEPPPAAPEQTAPTPKTNSAIRLKKKPAPSQEPIPAPGPDPAPPVVEKTEPPADLEGSQTAEAPQDPEVAASKLPQKKKEAPALKRTASTSGIASASIGGSAAKKPKRPLQSSTGTPTSKASPVVVAPPKPETSFLDSLFSDTIAQTEVEKKAARDREEKAKAARAAEKGIPRPSEAASKAKPIAAKAALSNPGKAAPISLQSRSGTPSRGTESSLQQRLAGQEQVRKEELAAMRAAAKKAREERAAKPGFDLLEQGIEMSAFEAPFLRDWTSHQQLAFHGKPDCKPFPFYRQTVLKEEGQEDGQLPKPLPHPWTFGSAFVFAGLRQDDS